MTLTHDAAVKTPADHPHQEEQVAQEVLVIVCTWQQHKPTHHDQQVTRTACVSIQYIHGHAVHSSAVLK